LGLLRRYGIQVPVAVLRGLESRTLSAQTLQVREDAHINVSLIATPWQSLQAAADAARKEGLAVHILSDSIEGESREVAKVHAEVARAIALGRSTLQKPCVILSGGETTVTVHPDARERGRGGRAGEFCLGLAQSLAGESNIWALAADTDGIDGVESNAGAIVAPDTVARAQAAGLSMQDHLDRHDSHTFFKALNDLVTTGPTYTNVNDFRAILVR
jgi:hydroxypyruvate reductase